VRCMILLAVSAGWIIVPSARAAEGTARWETEGRSFFLGCELKRAARAFVRALAENPGKAALHYWLGKSYARLAEVSSR